MEALRTLVRYGRDHFKEPEDHPVPRLVVLTTMRSTNTALAIANLLADGQIEQAQMLCRPLFEDMAVLHWLLMHDDQSFLIARFFDHQAAILVREHDYYTQEMGLPFSNRPGLNEALARRDELRNTFGRYAQRNWWGIRPDGQPITLPEVIGELEAFEPYATRLNGAEPALRDHYALSNMWANHQLHHSPRGLPFELARDGIRTRDRDEMLSKAAANAYWTFSQTLHIQLEHAAPEVIEEYWLMMRDTWSEVFAGEMTVETATEMLTVLRQQHQRERVDP